MPDSSRDSSRRSPTRSRHRGDDRPAALEELALDGRIVDLAVEDELEVAARPVSGVRSSWATVDTNSARSVSRGAERGELAFRARAAR